MQVRFITGHYRRDRDSRENPAGSSASIIPHRAKGRGSNYTDAIVGIVVPARTLAAHVSYIIRHVIRTVATGLIKTDRHAHILLYDDVPFIFVVTTTLRIAGKIPRGACVRRASAGGAAGSDAAPKTVLGLPG